MKAQQVNQETVFGFVVSQIGAILRGVRRKLPGLNDEKVQRRLDVTLSHLEDQNQPLEPESELGNADTHRMLVVQPEQYPKLMVFSAEVRNGDGNVPKSPAWLATFLTGGSWLSPELNSKMDEFNSKYIIFNQNDHGRLTSSSAFTPGRMSIEIVTFFWHEIYMQLHIIVRAAE